DVNKISRKEWLAYIHSDEELELTNGYESKIPGIENTFQNIPGFCNWSGHSIMKGDSQPWFDYRDGYISAKNPDDEVIRKMINIAETLNAKVQGDDGEFYDETYLSNQKENTTQTHNLKRKAWWKFW
ncbi:MAG: hypothetical protein Q7T76_21390, partial [Ferruginibacter sp.]|nr:hypothetical protein [Ferruginibacter sp.]